MNITSLVNVLKKCPHLDFLMFDACYMQSIEVIYELRSCADYIIGTPAETPADGAPYQLILPMFFNTEFTPSDIIETYYNSYINWRSSCGVVFSVVKSAELDIFYSATREKLSKYKSSIYDMNLLSVSQYLNLYMDRWDYNVKLYDIKAFMHAVLSDDEFAEWLTALDGILDSYKISSSIYSEEDPHGIIHIDKDLCCGISVSLPPSLNTTNERVVSAYGNLEWSLW
ncbi:MAG: hypothetical protein K6E54_01760 [Bacteroidaceae bacterium]|nr:hypothetical protein [Bacteroidaceae bacterium]